MPSHNPVFIPSQAQAGSAGFRIPNLRWLIAFALFFAAILNYVDRNVLGLLAPTIQKDLGITDQQYATIINFFFFAYGVAYVASGRIVDWLGVRISMALFVVWWSISNALTGFANSLRSLCLFRFMLGLGEAGLFTGSPKAVSEWFPASERGIAIGIYSFGGALGATLAPLLINLVAAKYGWRWVFAFSPPLALLWLVFWLWLYRSPAGHPRITDKERNYLAENLETAPTAPAPKISEGALWFEVLRQPFVWRLMLARLLTDPVWFFYQFWMPKYLHTARGLGQSELTIMWLVFLASDAGYLLGGFFSGRLIKWGLTAPKSRIAIMGFSACMTPISLFSPLAPTVGLVIALGMVVAYAHTAWLSNLSALVVDVAPKHLLGTAFGLMGCGSVMGAIMMNNGVAWLIDHHSYNACFYLMAAAHPTAFLIAWKVAGRPAAV
jgi:ACS family hexuronate transporter-like MFS transporter